MAFARITVDHARMGGLPCIRDLRIPVGTVLGQLAAGRSASRFAATSPIWSMLTSSPRSNTRLLRCRNVSYR